MVSEEGVLVRGIHEGKLVLEYRIEDLFRAKVWVEVKKSDSFVIGAVDCVVNAM